MSTRSLLILVILGAISLAGGWYFGPGSTPAASTATEAGALMFPGLAAQLTQARRIEIVHQGNTLAIAPKGDSAVWGLVDRGLYPVQPAKLRALLTGLTELRLTERRTADPDKFARLGVEAPDKADGTSSLLRVLDGAGKPLATLIVGHRRVRMRGDVPEGAYVRRPDQTQAWLAEGKLEPGTDPPAWLERDILDVPADRIAGVAVTRGQDHLTFRRAGDRLGLEAPAEHGKLDGYKLDEIARSLDHLTLQDVRPEQDVAGDPVGESVFTAIDGMAITARLTRSGKDLWARFSVTGPAAIGDDVRTLNARVAGWSYQLAPWREKSLSPALADLLAPPPAARPPESPPSGASKP